jgi:hypothetical protein
MSQTEFFTNQDGNSLLKKFEGVFEHMTSIRQFDALVGYFRTSEFFKVQRFLDLRLKVESSVISKLYFAQSVQ